MFVHKYQPCPVSISLDYAGPLVSVAVIIVTIIAVVYCCVLHLPSPQRVGRVAWEVCLSFMPGLLCGSNLERARGILDDRSRGDICVVCCWGLVAVHVLSQGDNGGCVTVASVDGIVGPSVALGIGVGVGLSLHFLRKWRFLSVILPEPSTLILYWRSGRAEIIFPVVFHRRLSGFWMVTVSPACNGHRLWVCLLYLSTNLALRLWRISSRHCAAAIHSGCGL